MHCIPAYPIAENNVNLSAIKNLKFMVREPITVGYSDFTSGIKVPAASIMVGATMVEKHLVLNKKMPSADNIISADPTMMKDMVKHSKKKEEQ
jgi:sialic acid synthase SpsE